MRLLRRHPSRRQRAAEGPRDDSGLQEWASFVGGGPITNRARWLCRGVPFGVGLMRTSACWLAVCALLDRCLTLCVVLRNSDDEPATLSTTPQPKPEPSTSAAEVGLLFSDDEGGSKKSGADADVKDDRQVRGRPLLCRPISVMLVTAGVFVAMAVANSPLLIRRWIRAQPTLRCLVPYHVSRLSSAVSHATTSAPLLVAAPVFVVDIVQLAVAACRRRRVPDPDDTRLVVVMSSPVAVCFFAVELLRVLGGYSCLAFCLTG